MERSYLLTVAALGRGRDGGLGRRGHYLAQSTPFTVPSVSVLASMAGWLVLDEPYPVMQQTD